MKINGIRSCDIYQLGLVPQVISLLCKNCDTDRYDEPKRKKDEKTNYIYFQDLSFDIKNTPYIYIYIYGLYTAKRLRF